MTRDDPDPTCPPANPALPDARPRPAGPERGRVDGEARRRIGRDLRLLYASVLGQPLPDRLTTLLDELAAASADREGSR